jgi:diguanylate cyclase (GGDEF)-like protein
MARLTLQNTPAVVALVATLGLLLLTIAAALRPGVDWDLWQKATLAAAWVAVLASAITARDRAKAAEENPSPGQAPGAAGGAPAPDSNSSAPLLDFARDLHGTLESDRLRLLIARRLPAILGRRDVWAVARFGARQQIIVPSVPGKTDAITLLSDKPRVWATYPMKAEDRTIGVLGTAVPPDGLNERDHRLLALVAALVGQSLSTANAFEAMREASLVDPLTGCALRSEGVRRFEAELRRADRSGTSLAVLMLDLDHFKSINDRFGHRAGDAVLSVVGETLLTTLRASDVRCRWGGEEFLLVLPDSSVERARRASDKLRQRIANTPVRVGEHTVRVTASIGITLTRPGETDVQQLLTRADAALYEAKSLGRNRLRFVLAAPAPPADGSTKPQEAAGKRMDRERREPTSRDGERARTEWAGPERRDPARRDRRRFPSPGRRRTDTEVLAGPWRAR